MNWRERSSLDYFFYNATPHRSLKAHVDEKCSSCVGAAFLVLLHVHDSIWKNESCDLAVKIVATSQVWCLIVQNAIDRSKITSRKDS